MQSESTQNEILLRARKLFSESQIIDVQKKTESLVTQTEQKISSLVNRLAELPKNISPQPIFEEIQKLQMKQAHYKAVLLEQKSIQQCARIPSENQFKNYLASLQKIDSAENKHKILAILLQKILVQKEGLELKL